MVGDFSRGHHELMFPPTRRILWDRTPRGPPRHLSIDLWQPVVMIPPGVLRELATRGFSGQNSTGSTATMAEVTLSARCSSRNAENQGCLLLTVNSNFCPDDSACRQPQSMGGCESLIRCIVKPGSSDTGWTADDLHMAVDNRNKRISSAGHLEVGDFLAWTAILSFSKQRRHAHFRLCAVYPGSTFTVTLLATPLRTLETPLLAQLRSPTRQSCLGHGFLTLDLGRRAVCLHENDSLVGQVPQVGVWVDLANESMGTQGTAAAWWDAAEVIDNPLIWAAAARFVHCQHVSERVWVDGATFLVMIVHRSQPASGGSNGSSTVGSGDMCISFFEAKHDEGVANGVFVAPADGPLTVDLANLPMSNERRAPICSDVSLSSPVRLVSHAVPWTEAVSSAVPVSKPEQQQHPQQQQQQKQQKQHHHHQPKQMPSSHSPTVATPRMAGGSLHSSIEELSSPWCAMSGPRSCTVHEEPRGTPPRPHPGPVATKTGMSPSAANSFELRSQGSESSGESKTQAPVGATATPPRAQVMPSGTIDALNKMSPSDEFRGNCTTLSEEPRFVRRALFEEERESTASAKTNELLSQCMRHAGTVREDLEKKTWTSSSAEEEQESLRKLVGMQQRQLAEMQQQLQNIQILVANLVSGNGMQAGNPYTSTTLADAATGPPSKNHLAAGPLVARVDSTRNWSSSSSNASGSRGSCSCSNMPAAQPMTRDVGVCVGDSLVGIEALHPRRPSCRDAAVDTSVDTAEASAITETGASRQQCMMTAASCCASLSAPEKQEPGCAALVTMSETSVNHGVEVERTSSGTTSKDEVPVESVGDVMVLGVANIVKECASTVIDPRVEKTVAGCTNAVTAPQIEHSDAAVFKDVKVGAAEVCSSPHVSTPVLVSAELETVSQKVVAAADMGSTALATAQSSGAWAGAGMATLGCPSIVCSEPSGHEGRYSKATLHSNDGPVGLLAEAVNLATGLPSCLRDSADTAGGATPPMRTAGAGSHDIQATGGNSTSWEDLGPDSVPRIRWPSSPLESDSESDMDERAVASDLGSVDSSSVFGLRLGLPQLPCTGTLGGPMAMPAGPLRMAF
mmetsp:Transcript_38328/g.76001  ORF Transcript_38328/g.76001 Transcript_38328/m.76001 type:complete len:1081 (+) Transcript_38328:29-3271(+)